MGYRFIIFLAIVVLGLIVLFSQNTRKKFVISTKFITRTAIFAAASIILYIVPAFNIPLPIFPSFLKIHIDEIPVFIAGFAYGPLSAACILVVKTLAKLPMSITGGVGELADFIYSLVFVLPAVLIYRRHRTIKGAAVGFAVAFVVQIIVASFLTSFVMIKFYIFVKGWPESLILQMCQKINPRITSLTWPFLFYVAIPFNALKNVIVIIFTFLLYKRMHTFIDRLEA